MSAPKGNKNALGNKGGGRKSTYEPRFSRIAKSVTLLGATDADLARVFEVSEATIADWKRKHIEFSKALKDGKMEADAQVAVSLFRRAKGYNHKAVKVFQINNPAVKEGEPVVRSFEHEYIQRYPPDPTSCIFWLKNRQPDKWRDKPVEESLDSDEILKELGEAIRNSPKE